MSTMSVKSYRGLLEHYELGEEVLGNGAKGTVHRGTRLADGLEVAVKVVPKRELNEWSQTALAREVAVLKSMKHGNIVTFLDALEDQKFVYIVTEYLCGGDLYTRLHRNRNGLGEREALILVRQMLQALKVLHDRGISHRDVKLENFVFATEEDEAEQCLKLIDFGLVYWRKPGTMAQATLPCGTVQYLSPEVAARKEYVPEQADMWGVGIVLYALICRKLPFSTSRRDNLISKIRNAEVTFEGARWEAVTKRTKELGRRLLSKRGADRPTVDEALDLLELCIQSEHLSDIDEDEDDHLSDLARDKQRNSATSRSSPTHVSHRPKSQESGHKRQRSSSDVVKHLFDGIITATTRRRENETGVESEFSHDEDDDEDADDDDDEEDEVPAQSYFEGVCQAYGNI